MRGAGRPRAARPGWRLARALGLALVVGALGMLPGPVGMPSVATALAAGPDLTLVTVATYTVQPDQGRVRVTVDLTAANRRADTRVNRFYFDHAFLAVQPGATGPALAKGPPGASAGVASRTADATILRINFGPRLYGGKTTSLRFTFDLVDVGTATRRLVRVGASLVAFPVWAFASDGTAGSSVSVRFPKGYEVSVDSGSFATRSAAPDGGVTLATGPLASPLVFFAYVSATQPATYRTATLSVDDRGSTIPLTLRAWADDRTWASRVGDLFARALPALSRDIGLAWPHREPVVVQEAVSRSTGGYAGLYDPQAGVIQVAYWASQPVIVHEAAHGWFNGALLADRWAVEGFASLYAQRALGTLKIKAATPVLSDKLKAAAFPLNAWPATPDPAAGSEAYGYAASSVLAGLIAERAGAGALSRVWADARDRIGAYQPPPARGGGTPETVAGPPDWRGLLDLLEAETGADFTDLWRAWVARPGDAVLLGQRAAARSAYRDLLAAADGWTLPRSIRDALRAWRFEGATTQMSAARSVLAQRTILEGRASAAGVDLPSSAQDRFEAGDLGGAVREMQRQLVAVAAIEAAASSRSTGAGDPLAGIGLAGAHPDRDLAAARAALVADDAGTAVALADGAEEVWTGAHDEGRRRALMAGALLAAIGLLGTSLASRLWRARRRRARVDAA